MLNVQRKVDGLKDLEKYTLYIERLSTMKTDINFQKYIQQKCMEALERIMNIRLVGGTTNDDAISIYRSSNHIIEDVNGFIIYNDAKIPANAKDTSGYPDDQFSIALAFEYGVGIIGQNTNNPNAWNYNINNYNFGWYFKDSDGVYKQTGGYQGFEIYRYTAEEIKAQLPKWVNDYYKMKEV